MAKQIPTPWHIVYRKLAEAMYELYQQNGSYSGTYLYRLAETNKEFMQHNPWIGMYKDLYQIESVDPVALFSAMNERKMKIADRYGRINGISSLFPGLPLYEINSIDFDGCPAPFSIRIRSARNVAEQQDIWVAFANVMRDSQNADLETHIKRTQSWYGLAVPSFTIFLFWIDARNFLPLDSKTVALMTAAGIIKRIPRNAEEYHALMPETDTTLYLDIAREANELKPDTDPYREACKRFYALFIKKTSDKDNSVKPLVSGRNDFRLVAIRMLPDCNERWVKVLEKLMFYKFYKAYVFNDDGTVITYHPETDLNLYSIEVNEKTVPVNLSAIVGKNGSGKSTITEVLYALLNNLGQTTVADNELIPVTDIKAEFYFHADTMYRIGCDGQQVTYTAYNCIQNIYTPSIEVPMKPDHLREFFYSIAINYSHFALNELELGQWLHPLFFKNDSYQVPLVISPMREKGNINMNRENELVKNRLVTNILLPYEISENDFELLMLTIDGRYASALQISFDEEKANRIIENNNRFKIGFRNEVIWKAAEVFEIPPEESDNVSKFTETAYAYLFHKLANIVSRYPNYNAYFDFFEKNRYSHTIVPDDVTELNNLLYQIKKDDSHAIYKFKQVVNFLRFRHWDFLETDGKYDVPILESTINRLRINNNTGEELERITLIPPSFFKADIILNDGSFFSSLSSGEKQWIYTMSSIVYHLNNLNSVNDSDNQVKYQYINILFDEIELYFHPDMQRQFISQLLTFLKRADLEFIAGINIVFVTHSPFILSDIPHHNLLTLKHPKDKTDAPGIENDRTLGANIHELLRHNFFMSNGVMGEFAREKISSALRFLQNPAAPDQQEWTKESVRKFIDLIGESIIRDSMMDMYNNAFLSTTDEVDEAIRKLEILREAHNQKQTGKS